MKINSIFKRNRSQVLVTVPVFNEEESIGSVINQIHDYGIGEIVVIDDGSTDRTIEMAEKEGALVLRLLFNLGIGGAVQAGFKFADEMGYPFVVRIDGDGQHKVEEIEKLLSIVKRGEVDIAIGSRFCPGNRTYNPSIFRNLGIRWFSFLISTLIREPVYDPTSGMLAMNRRALKILARYYPQDYPEVEARVLMKKAKLKVVEIPVEMKLRSTGLSSITLFRSIYYMFKVSLATLLAAIREEPEII